MGVIPAIAATIGGTLATLPGVATIGSGLAALGGGSAAAGAGVATGIASGLSGMATGIHSATQDAPKTPKPQTPLEDPRIAAQKQQEERRQRAAQGGRQSTIKSTPLGRSGGGARYGAAPKAQGARKILMG